MITSTSQDQQQLDIVEEKIRNESTFSWSYLLMNILSATIAMVCLPTAPLS